MRAAFGADAGPLCRPLDRARSRALLLAVLGVLAALVLGALVTVRGIDDAPARAAARAATSHRIEAAVLGRPRADATMPGARFNAGERVTVQWTYPAGHTQTGRIDLPHSLALGAGLPIWVGDDGGITDPPPSATELTVLAVGLGCTVLLASTGAVLTGHGLRRRALSRRTERLWATGWEAVEPHWSGRLGGRPGSAATGTDAP